MPSIFGLNPLYFNMSQQISPSEAIPTEPLVEEKALKRERVKFGFGSILFQSEEVGLGALPTVVIRSFGGSDFHVGLIGGASGLSSFMQFAGNSILRWQGSNRRAMIASMLAGFLVAAGIGAVIFMGSGPEFRSIALILFLILSLAFMGLGGIQWNIETNWIGDLVSKERLGRFNSYKWALSVFGIVAFTYLIGRVADRFPHSGGYSAIYAMFAVSFLIACLVYRRIPDRKPQVLSFFSKDASREVRLNYRSVALWYYSLFFIFWAGGRSMLSAFMFLFLKESYGYSMTKIALLVMIQHTVSVLVLLFMGHIAERLKGSRLPLFIISAMVCTSMLLWCTTPWFGIVPIILYQIIAGGAGMTHGMLATNLGLEIFPATGRAAYIGFSRIMLGTACIVTPIIAGALLTLFQGFEITVAGALVSRYHLLFLLSALVTGGCLIPLAALKNKRVENLEAMEKVDFFLLIAFCLSGSLYAAGSSFSLQLSV